jgi:autotransporter-associated beta strand protein
MTFGDAGSGTLTLTATGAYTAATYEWMKFTGTNDHTSYVITGGTYNNIVNNIRIINLSGVDQYILGDFNVTAGQAFTVQNNGGHGNVHLGRVISTNTTGNNNILTVNANDSYATTGLTSGTLFINEVVTNNNYAGFQGRVLSSSLPRIDYADLPSISIGNITGNGRINFNALWNSVTLTGHADTTTQSFDLVSNMRLILDYTADEGSKLGGRTVGFNASGMMIIRGGTGAGIGESISGNSYLNHGNSRIQREAGSTATFVTSVYRNTDTRGTLDVNADGVFGATNASAEYSNQAGSGAAQAFITIGTDGVDRDFAKRGTDNLYYAFTDYTAFASSFWDGTATGLLAGSGSLALGPGSQAGSRYAGFKISGHATSGDLADNTLALGDYQLQLLAGGLIFTGKYDYEITGAAGSIMADNKEFFVWTSGVGDLIISSSITGANGLTKSGAGTLILSRDNLALNGKRVTINAGTLVMDSDYALGETALLGVNGGTLALNGHNLTVTELRGYDFYNSRVENSAVTTSTLTLAGAGDYSGVQYTNFSGNLRVLVTNSTSGGFSFMVANDHTGGLEFKGNVSLVGKAGVTPTNIFGGITVGSNQRIYHREAMGSGGLFFSGTAGVLTSMGGVGNSDGIYSEITISGKDNMLGIDSDNTRFRGAWHGAADAEMSLLHNFGGRTIWVQGDMSDYAGKLYLIAARPRDNRTTDGRFQLTGTGANLENTAVVLGFSGTSYLDGTWTYGYNLTFLELAAPGDYKVGSLASAYIDKNQADGGMSPYLPEDQDGTVMVRAVGDNGAYNFEVGNRGDSTVFDGHLTNNAQYTIVNVPGTSDQMFNGWTDTDVNHVLSLTKVGDGTLNLTNLNTYSGTTIVSGGVLLLSGTSNLSRTTAVTVSGGTLQLTDSGTIANLGDNKFIEVTHGVLLVDTAYAWTQDLKFHADGVLGGSGTIATDTIYFEADSAGVTGGGLGTTGTLTFSAAQEFWGDFTYYFDIFSNADHDQLNFSGGLTFAENDQITLNVNNLGGLEQFDNVLIISGQLDNYDQATWQLDEGFSLKYLNNELLLSYSIPEPSTWLLLGAGATLLVFLRRRR